MNEADWLTQRNPPPPPELAAAIRAALRDGGSLPVTRDPVSATRDPLPATRAPNGGSISPTPQALLEAAARLLSRVLASDCEHRKSALDLLTVDALVTHALEMAADDPDMLEEFPEIVLRRIAATKL